MSGACHSLLFGEDSMEETKRAQVPGKRVKKFGTKYLNGSGDRGNVTSASRKSSNTMCKSKS